jgi:nucleoside-diphosphate-sugar epimerase
MRILVTGANGFIGTNFIKKFSNKSDILAVSTRNTNIASFSDVEFLELELKNYDNLPSIVNKFKPEIVLHLAWEGSNTYYHTNSINQFENITNSFKLLEAISELENVHFIGMGTGGEYGYYSDYVSESFEENPVSHYGLAKLLFKQGSEIFCSKKNITWTWLRPFMCYGPYDVKTRLIPKVINSCLLNESLRLDSCESKVDYLYIDDAIDAIEKIIYLRKSGVFNICSNKEYQVRSIIEVITNHFQVNNVIFDSSLNRKNFCESVIGDNSKLINELEWTHKTQIFEGLLKTIDFFKGK